MRALITGVLGQDGSYLADILLSRGYEVHGLYRHSSKDNLQNVSHNLDNPCFKLHKGDVIDGLCLDMLIERLQPDEIYHMADQDNVDWSYKIPSYQIEITVKAVVNLLTSVHHRCPRAKVFLPCSATMFGSAQAPQTEETPFDPRSPYACAKVAVYHIARMYRQNYNLYVNVGIMFNHDSPRRNGNYLLHKICKAAVTGEKVAMFDVEQEVAIGYAEDYMRYVCDMMQLPASSDYTVCNVCVKTIRSLCSTACFLADTNVNDCFDVTKSSWSYRSPTLFSRSEKLNAAVNIRRHAHHNDVDLLQSIITKYRSVQ